MSKIKVYDTHTEITNGLFIIDKVMFEVGLDDLEEFTSRQEGVNLVFSDAKLTYTGNPFIGDEYSRALQIERFRIENERLSSHLRNMGSHAQYLLLN
jgi:hypothetical protein